jgi:L-fuconolactonase
MAWALQNKKSGPMQRIDAHQHFWKYDPVRDSWITDQMSRLRNDFLPQELGSILKQNGFDGTVSVQADQSELENSFLLANAEKFDFIKGVVGWIDLQADNIEERLSFYKSFEKLKGFRHILQSAPDRDLMLHPSFKNGIGQLQRYGFTYDILIFPDQIRYASELIAAFPEQKFVVDHLAKPYIKFRKTGQWEKDIREMAAYPNAYCKISGFVTEADWDNWKADDIKPYIDVVVDAFGTGRLMFGSDWPVCLVAADYEEVLGVVQTYFSSFSQNEQDKVFGQNAIEFYNL